LDFTTRSKRRRLLVAVLCRRGGSHYGSRFTLAVISLPALVIISRISLPALAVISRPTLAVIFRLDRKIRSGSVYRRYKRLFKGLCCHESSGRAGG